MSYYVNRLRFFIVGLLIGKTPYAANLRLIGTLAIDFDMCKNANFINVDVNKSHSEKIPDCAFYFAVDVKYDDGCEPRPL